MPIMNAANAPHAVAIKISDDGRRRTEDGGRTALGVARSRSSVFCCGMFVMV
jgi:hypothetical protein